MGVVLFLALLASVVPFFVTGRYRLPLAVLLCPAAGLAVERVWANRRVPRELIYLGGAAALYLVLAYFPLYQGEANRVHMLNVEGSTLLAHGDFEAARPILEEALALDPYHPEVLNNLAFVVQKQGDVPRALELYSRAITSNPRQAETYLNLEELYRNQRKPREALAILDQLEEARGGQVADVAAKIAYRRGVNSLSLRDTTAARSNLEAAVAVDPQLAGAWISLSILYRLMGLPEESVEASGRAVALSPTAPEAQISHGRALEQVGRYEEAITAYANAIQLGVQDPDLYYRMGHLLVQLGRDEEAGKFFLAANQGRPHVPSLWELAALYERSGQTEEAVTAYRALLQADPGRAEEARARLDALGAKGGGGR
jgi:tetratricopeptide (TPR) repeat protein